MLRRRPFPSRTLPLDCPLKSLNMFKHGFEIFIQLLNWQSQYNFDLWTRSLHFFFLTNGCWKVPMVPAESPTEPALTPSVLEPEASPDAETQKALWGALFEPKFQLYSQATEDHHMLFAQFQLTYHACMHPYSGLGSNSILIEASEDEVAALLTPPPSEDKTLPKGEACSSNLHGKQGQEQQCDMWVSWFRCFLVICCTLCTTTIHEWLSQHSDPNVQMMFWTICPTVVGKLALQEGLAGAAQPVATPARSANEPKVSPDFDWFIFDPSQL